MQSLRLGEDGLEGGDALAPFLGDDAEDSGERFAPGSGLAARSSTLGQRMLSQCAKAVVEAPVVEP